MKQKLILLERMIRISVNAHSGQYDKAGVPYILHPLRVMNALKTIDGKIVGVGHDLVEDTGITPEFLLSEGFPGYIVDAIISVSRKKDETYKEFIQRAKKNEIGRLVKIEDMRDNCDLFRMHELPDKHLSMVKKYHAGIKELEPNHDNRISI